MNKAHENYMLRALQLAERGRNTVSPNPMVGVVIVKNQTIIGEGYHIQSGTAHAEVHALTQAGTDAAGADLYTTLEPCCHTGRTPPCTQAIIAAKIKRVIIANRDPNPLVAGRGIAELQAAGVEVISGPYEKEAKALNVIFEHFIQQRTPFIIAKWAMSLNGKTISPASDRNITSTETQLQAHALRAAVDAILIGGETARRDNPRLTVRLPNCDKKPLRIILTTSGKLSPSLHLLSDNESPTLIVTTDAGQQSLLKLTLPSFVEIAVLPHTENGQVAINHLVTYLGQREISSLLIEGGMSTVSAFLNAHLVNQISAYVAPLIITDSGKQSLIGEFHPINHDFHFNAIIEGT